MGVLESYVVAATSRAQGEVTRGVHGKEDSPSHDRASPDVDELGMSSPARRGKARHECHPSPWSQSGGSRAEEPQEDQDGCDGSERGRSRARGTGSAISITASREAIVASLQLD